MGQGRVGVQGWGREGVQGQGREGVMNWVSGLANMGLTQGAMSKLKTLLKK